MTSAADDRDYSTPSEDLVKVEALQKSKSARWYAVQVASG